MNILPVCRDLLVISSILGTTLYWDMLRNPQKYLQPPTESASAPAALVMEKQQPYQFLAVRSGTCGSLANQIFFLSHAINASVSLGANTWVMLPPTVQYGNGSLALIPPDWLFNTQALEFMLNGKSIKFITSQFHSIESVANESLQLFNPEQAETNLYAECSPIISSDWSDIRHCIDMSSTTSNANQSMTLGMPNSKVMLEIHCSLPQEEMELHHIPREMLFVTQFSSAIQAAAQQVETAILTTMLPTDVPFSTYNAVLLELPWELTTANLESVLRAALAAYEAVIEAAPGFNSSVPVYLSTNFDSQTDANASAVFDGFLDRLAGLSAGVHLNSNEGYVTAGQNVSRPWSTQELEAVDVVLFEKANVFVGSAKSGLANLVKVVRENRGGREIHESILVDRVVESLRAEATAE